MIEATTPDLISQLMKLVKSMRQMKSIKVMLLLVFSSLSITASFVGFEGFLTNSALGQHVNPSLLAAVVTIVFQALLIVGLSKIHGDLGQERVSAWFIYTLTCSYSILMAYVFWFGVFFADTDALEVNENRFNSVIADFSAWPAEAAQISKKFDRLKSYAKDEYQSEIDVGQTCGDRFTGDGEGRRAKLRKKYVVMLEGISRDAASVNSRVAGKDWKFSLEPGLRAELRSFQLAINRSELSSIKSEVRALVELLKNGAGISGKHVRCSDDLLTTGLENIYRDVVSLDVDRVRFINAEIPHYQDPQDIEENFARATERLSSIAIGLLGGSGELSASYMDGVAFAFAFLIEIIIFSISTWRGALYLDKPLSMSDFQFISDWDDPGVYHAFGRTFSEIKVAPLEVHECLTEFASLPELLDSIRLRRCEIDRVTCLVFPYDNDEQRNEPLLRCLDHLEQGWSAAITLEEQVPYDRLSPAVKSRLRQSMGGKKPNHVRIMGLNPIFWREVIRDNLRIAATDQLPQARELTGA